MRIRTIARLVVAALLPLLAANAALARPNPCLQLAGIVSAYHNTSTNGGKTAAQIFAGMGELTFMARFAQAASHVQNHEPEGTAINVVAPNADTAYGELNSKVRWLDAADLQPFSGVSLAPANVASVPFCTTGLLGGIYVRENAAVLLGRARDALFVGFRATNDGWKLTSNPATPDAYDWTHQDRHYGRYQYILSAIDGYLAAHPEITRVYLAGDSLGGAMVQRYLQLHPGNTRLRGVTFGSPGTPSVAFQDDRLWTFINDIDPILLVPSLNYNLSGKRFLIHVGVMPSIPPDAVYHAPQVYYRIMRHLDAHHVGKPYLATKFAGNLTRWNAISLRVRRTAVSPDDFTVGIPGKIYSLPGSTPRVLAGGDGTDKLIGGIGAGDLFGFGGADCLDGLTRPERLFGGAGPDSFLLHGNYLAFGGDVMDFHSGVDKLVVLSTLPAYQAVVDGRNFIRGSSATGFRPTLVYDRNLGHLRFDMDGSGPLPSYEVARLAGKPVLLASDIALVQPAVCK